MEINLKDADHWHAQLFELLQQPGIIRNLQTNYTYYQQNDTVVWATVNDYVAKNCYVVSPLTQIIDYARDELPKVKSAGRRYASLALMRLIERPLRSAGISRLQVLNNQCTSTNIYGQVWQRLDICALRQQALARYPCHALMLRSLNHWQNPRLIQRLQQDGWLPIVSRQVYCLVDAKYWWSKVNARRDDKLLTQPNWCFERLDPNNLVEMARAEKLYNQLYLDKYSVHNIQFTAHYLADLSRSGLLQLFGLFRKESTLPEQEMLGVIGLLGLETTITVPIVGYDTQQPEELALYRRLIAFALRHTMSNNLMLNLSSGASGFKRLRGCQPVIEYSFVYVKHLKWLQRMAWRFCSSVSQTIYLPILKKFKL